MYSPDGTFSTFISILSRFLALLLVLWHSHMHAHVYMCTCVLVLLCFCAFVLVYVPVSLDYFFFTRTFLFPLFPFLFLLFPCRPKQEDGEGVERKNNAVHEKEPASEPLRVETIAKVDWNNTRERLTPFLNSPMFLASLRTKYPVRESRHTRPEAATAPRRGCCVRGYPLRPVRSHSFQRKYSVNGHRGRRFLPRAATPRFKTCPSLLWRQQNKKCQQKDRRKQKAAVRHHHPTGSPSPIDGKDKAPMRHRSISSHYIYIYIYMYFRIERSSSDWIDPGSVWGSRCGMQQTCRRTGPCHPSSQTAPRG